MEQVLCCAACNAVAARNVAPSLPSNFTEPPPVDALNRTFREPLVRTRGGGAGGGGADLTPFGANLVASYRAMERDTRKAIVRRLTELEKALAPAAASAPVD